MRRLLALLFAFTAVASAQETVIHSVYDTESNTYADVVALFGRPAPRGYLPVRVKLVNRLKTGRSVSLATTSTSGNSQLKSSFSFDVPGEKSMEQDILVPLVTATESGTCGVEFSLTGGFGITSNRIYGEHAEKQPAVLLSERLFPANASKLDSEANSAYSSSYGRIEFATQFSAGMAPDDWRAFSGYDAVLLTDSEWTSLSPGARNALVAWTRLGGRLVIYSESGATLESLSLPKDSSFGMFQIIPLNAALDLDAPATVRMLSGGLPPQSSSIADDYSAGWPLQNLFGKRAFNYALFIIVLLAFGIIVGPVNLFILAKSGRRHRLFITTPLISLAASLLLVGLILLQDGFGGQGMRSVLMEVRPDNNENAAYIHQEQISRTGVLTSGSFTLDESSALSQIPIGDSRWARVTRTGRNGAGYAADFRDGKLQTSGDWFQSRSEHGHYLDAVVPTRGRIELTGKTGNPRLLSTFDFPLQTVFYRDDSKQWWRAENVGPGSAFEPITVTETIVQAALTIERNRFGNRDQLCLDRVASRTGAFVAFTNDAPAVATNRNIRWKETRTVVTGPVVNP